jgi:hypothetical protein
MPRSILEIDVNDDRFKQFLALYQQYQDSLKNTEGFWKSTEAAIDKAADATERVVKETDKVVDANERIVETTNSTVEAANSMNDVVVAIAASTTLIVEAMEQTERSTEHAASAMGRVSDHAKTAAGWVRTATVDLLKWSALSLGAGLLGGGVGLWGLDRLGESVAATRRTSMGLGISAGELAAFNVNYGPRLGLGTGFLETIQDARSDLSRAGTFGQLGIPWTQVQGEDTAQLTTDVIRRAHALWQNAGPGGHTVQNMQANGLAGLGMDFNTWQTIGRQSAGDLAKWGEQYRRDARGLNVSDPTQKAWTDFVTQLDRAGKQIEKVFVTALQPLIDSNALPKLSESIEHLVEKFFGNPAVVKGIDGFAGAISSFGDYLGTQKVADDMKRFVDGVGYAADKIEGVLKFLHLWPSNDAPAVPVSPGPAGGGPGIQIGPRQFNPADPSLPSPYGPAKSWRDVYPLGPGYSLDFSAIEKQNQLPPGLLKALGWEESHLNPNIGDSPAGAQGMFQFMPGTQKDYHVTDPHDVKQEANAAGRYMYDLLQKYRGDLEKALAAYNWGPKHVDDDVAAHGAAWRQFAPKETRNYIQDIIGNTPGSPIQVNMNVTVTNQTGAQVAVTANAVR